MKIELEPGEEYILNYVQAAIENAEKPLSAEEKEKLIAEIIKVLGSWADTPIGGIAQRVAEIADYFMKKYDPDIALELTRLAVKAERIG